MIKFREVHKQKGRFSMEYYEKLRQIREDNDKNQTQIAEILGIHQTYYSKQERGVKPFQIDQIIKLCEYYQVSADYILGLPRDLSWPREKNARKGGQARETNHSTKYSVLLLRRTSWVLTHHGCPLSLQTRSSKVLPKIVIETRKELRRSPELLFVSKETYSCS